MKKILIIKAHPKKNSFCNALVQSYVTGAKETGHQIKTIELRNLSLAAFIKHTHEKKLLLPPDLLKAQSQISWADHLIFAYPTWWTSPPAILKIFLEIVFHSGFAFRYKKSSGFAPNWDRLLPNKSARLLVTMDSPTWYYTWFVGDPGYKMLKDILNFCGIKPVTKNYFGSVKMSTNKQRQQWLKQAHLVGLNEK